MGAMLTLPSSMALAGEELLELLFTTGGGPGSEAECFPEASDGHRGRGKCLSSDPNSLLGVSLRLSVAERGLPGDSTGRGGEHSPPLTGDGPKSHSGSADLAEEGSVCLVFLALVLRSQVHLVSSPSFESFPVICAVS